jgi:ABC-type multidrug transport system fused ATPase/permease subunit
MFHDISFIYSYALFRNILRQEIGWFDVHNSGELSNRLIDDLGEIIHRHMFLLNHCISYIFR